MEANGQDRELDRLRSLSRSPDHSWALWGSYLPERQWGTVREDYSADGDAWTSFPREQAISRAYRWGEDGLLGWCDMFCNLCFAPVLWNGKDPFLKERLFGLAGPEGNHGEDVKELYYYLDAVPTHSYAKALYKYPQAPFPYDQLLKVNRQRSRQEPEFEIVETGVFDDLRYFDFTVEYAKRDYDDILVQFTATNRGPEAALLHFLPTLWFRNTWSWGPIEEAPHTKPLIEMDGAASLKTSGSRLEDYRLECETAPDQFLFTENETDYQRLFKTANASPYVKDAFHRAVVHGHGDAVNPERQGTKTAAWYQTEIPAGGQNVWRFRLCARNTAHREGEAFGPAFDETFQLRRDEADAFYARVLSHLDNPRKTRIARAAYAGLIWSKQYYCLVQTEWLSGDPNQEPPPEGHADRNSDWVHLFNRDILSMPDKWEYPYYCTWDLAFHAVTLGRIDPGFAKGQMLRLLREWYLHPNGQIPAYEWNFGDVNPPVHGWAAWELYSQNKADGQPDLPFLEAVFHKLLLNFTWWVNRKDPDGNNLFAGGFLGLDNIGVFDRSKPLPTGGTLKQADGSAWMAFYCLRMLRMAMELARHNPVYEDLASKFFNHYVRIIYAINSLGGTGLWDEQDGFYYDMLDTGDQHEPLRVRSIVGLLPMLACEIITRDDWEALPGLRQRVEWFLRHRTLLARHCRELNASADGNERLLALPTREYLEKLLARMFDETEFLSPFGLRSVSKYHQEHPYTYWVGSQPYSVDYEPGEGTTGMFGGNSNWRGPVWFPVNYLLIESLRTYDRFYGGTFMVEFPTGSGRRVRLGQAADLLATRLVSLFMPDATGQRPCHGDTPLYKVSAHPSDDLILFHEYYHAETGRGCGASHQTGWTALVAELLQAKGKSAANRGAEQPGGSSGS